MTRSELLQTAKPILFNTEMVQAILNGRKTCTRRLVKFLDKRNPNWAGYVKDGLVLYNGNNHPCNKPSPYKLGDILYVRELWCKYDSDHVIDDVKYAYKADATPVSEETRNALGYKWHPSIHMPKEAARIFLRLTDVRIEKLNDISFNDIMAEGMSIMPEAYNDPDNAYLQAVETFKRVWDSTIKKSDLDRYGWNANPWVWIIEFERVEVLE